MRVLERAHKLVGLWLVLVLIAVFPIACKEGPVPPTPKGGGLCSTAWLEGDEVNIAIANNSKESEELTIGVGGYVMGPKIIDAASISVEGQGMVICKFKKKVGAVFKGEEIRSDTVFIYGDKEMKDLLDSLYVQGYHPAQEHCSASKYVAKAGDKIQFSLVSPDDIEAYEKVIWAIRKAPVALSGKLSDAEIIFTSGELEEIEYLNSSEVGEDYLPGVHGKELLGEMETSHVIEFVKPAEIDFELVIPPVMRFTTVTVGIMTYEQKEGDEITCGGLGGPRILIRPENAGSE